MWLAPWARARSGRSVGRAMTEPSGVDMHKVKPIAEDGTCSGETSTKGATMRKPSPAMMVALASLFVALGGVGVAATGGNFILGQSNTAPNTTGLSAPVAGAKALQVTNTNTTSGSTALGLNVASGHPPLTVNSPTKVGNLNADLLDGIDSTGFLRSTLPVSLAGSAPGDVFDSTNTGSGYAVAGYKPNGGGAAVHGVSSTGRGVEGFSGSGQAVYGHSGTQVGIVGDSNSFDGVWGATHSATAAGVSGHGAGGYGVWGGTTGAGTGVYGSSLGGNGVIGDSSASFASGVYGHTSGGGYGVAGRAEHGAALFGDTTDGWAMQAQGNATQSRDKSGFVKAMAYISPLRADPIANCFSSQLPPGQATSGTCGFTFTRLDTGRYIVDFGFKVDDRFVSVTPYGAAEVGNGRGSNVPSTAWAVLTFEAQGVGGFADYPFFVFVY
jgi:hypothetical protein